MKVGPINQFDGFPVWYKDDNGLRLQLNVDPTDPFSGITFADLPDPTQPVSFPDNYPDEAFYLQAEAEMTTGTGERARLVLALEAAFVNEVPRVNEQIVFARVRVRVDGLQANAQYTVTHPYGVDTFIAEADPRNPTVGEINFTEDFGGMNGGDFDVVLNSRVQPFLQWDPNVAPAAPAGYIGNPDVLHPIIGSPFVDQSGQPQNYFRIEGPGIGIGSPDRSTTPGFDPDHCIETRNFSLLGKISTISGVDVPRATFTQNADDVGVIDVFATSDDTDQSIQVTGTGIDPTVLSGSNGQYFARVQFTGNRPPRSITVTNVTDEPDSRKDVVPVDFITASANYDIDSQDFTIEAFSSDAIGTPTLSAADFGLGELVIPSTGLSMNLPSPPATVTIRSTAGGSRTIPVTVNGTPSPPAPVTANAGDDATVLFGATVTLNGSGSTGTIISFHWTQLSGTPVALLNEDTLTPSFIAPNTTETLIFQLSVTGEDRTSTDEVHIHVIDSTPVPTGNLTVTRAEFRTRDAEWRITGTSDVLGSGAAISIYIGNETAGALLAQVPGDALGEWEYRVEGSTIQPDETRAISIQSSSGGTLPSVPITIRR
ncbi:IPT/TIG domain protein [Sporosarcina sp. Marseille-Q4943]|uniref:PKD domain-containing protein n=1 Tax=Sporosarcina sp. Marseille-Q4943 TaxID=2942204 RepID=UPI00208DAC36|nr:IPT/TIG domain protein [Sporosarcina sp. Marseille-Q4943]